MQIRNGKAYVLSFVAHHPSTRWDRIKDAEEKAVRERLDDMNLLMDRLPRGVELKLEGTDTLQVAREGLMITGKSDKGAEVTVQCEGAQTSCSMASSGSFTADIIFVMWVSMTSSSQQERKARRIRRLRCRCWSQWTCIRC